MFIFSLVVGVALGSTSAIHSQSPERSLGVPKQGLIQSLQPAPLNINCIAQRDTKTDTKKTWLEVANGWSTLFALFLSVPSILFALRSLSISQRGLKAKVSLDALQLLEGSDGKMREYRLLLENYAKTWGNRPNSDEDKIRNFRYLDRETQNKLRELARAYDMAGLLVEHGLIPTSLLFDFYSRPIALAWNYLGAWIKKEGLDRNPPQRGHMERFRILAAGAQLFRNEKEHARQKLEKIRFAKTGVELDPPFTNEKPIFEVCDDAAEKWRSWNAKKWYRWNRKTWE